MVRSLTSPKFWLSVRNYGEVALYHIVSYHLTLLIFSFNILCILNFDIFTGHFCVPTSIAFLSFGLGDPEYLTMSAGISTALFGALEFTLYLKYPELFDETEGGAH